MYEMRFSISTQFFRENPETDIEEFYVTITVDVKFVDCSLSKLLAELYLLILFGV